MKSENKKFTQQLASLKQFFLHYGHVHVPNFPEHETLFDFCNQLRNAKKVLPKNVVKELDAMGFRWDLNLSNELRWYFHYDELKKYHEEFGHSRVTDKKENTNTLLFGFSGNEEMKKYYPQKKKRLLKALDFAWSDDLKKEKEAYWKSMFDKLKKFYKKHGHSAVPDRFKEDEKLGRWVSTVRYGEDHLEDWKKALLHSVKFRFREDIKEEKLNHRKNLFSKLQNFYKANGHANVPEGYKDVKLAHFVAYLRMHPERVSDQEKKILKKWKFLFSEELKDSREKLWLSHFKKLEQFKKKNGHCRVSSAYADQPLARWVAKQRKQKKEGTLKKDREKLLKSIGFSFHEDVAEYQEKKWKEKYDKLIAFKKKYNTTNISETYKDKELLYWVGHQRTIKKRMPEHRRKLLEKIGFNW